MTEKRAEEEEEEEEEEEWKKYRDKRITKNKQKNKKAEEYQG